MVLLPDSEENPETTYTVGVTVNDGTNPLEGVSVTLTDTSDSSKTFTNGNNGTGAAGGSNITSVPAGTYSISASLTGYDEYTSANNLVVDGDETVTISMTETE